MHSSLYSGSHNCSSEIQDSWRSIFLEGIKRVENRLSPIWEGGRRIDARPRVGRHWILPGCDRPVSVATTEGYFLYNLASILKARNVLEIGTGFGYSTLWLAGGVYEVYREDAWVGTIDSLQEGNIGLKGQRFARWASKTIKLDSIISFFTGSSPKDLPSILQGRTVDLAFIDGYHHNGQPFHDFAGLLPFLGMSGTVIWHDYDDRYSVPGDVHKSLAFGFQYRVFPTSCGMAVGFTNPNCIKLIEDAFEAALLQQFIGL